MFENPSLRQGSIWPKQVHAAQRLLYFTYGLLPIIAGLDKFSNALTTWTIYLNTRIPMIFQLTPESFMTVLGIIEIFAGLLVFWKPRIGGMVVTGFLLAFAINIISIGGYYDVAMRDIVMAVGAYALVLLSQAVQSPQNS